ncbi:MAG: YihY/virulence factor BrkB family protein [Tissierellia bacterium]|nr:YihY/virulence factor BrkB family protein [Tissierellia bacterium]
MKNLLKKLLKHKFIIFIDNFLYRIKSNNVFAISAQLSYFLFLSLFPFLIVFLNILSFVSIVRMDILYSFIQYLPLDVQNIISNFIKDLAIDSSKGLLSIAAIAGIWTASAGVTPVVKAINRAYDYEETRSYFKLKAISIVFTIALNLLLLLVFITLVLGEFIGKELFNFLGIAHIFVDIWSKTRLIIPVVFMIIIFALLYKYSPCLVHRKRVKLRRAIPGGLFTTFGWILTSNIFSIYVTNSNKFSTTYGSLGGLIVLLIWLYISSIIIVLGGEFNATLEYFRKNNYKVDSKRSIIVKTLNKPS